MNVNEKGVKGLIKVIDDLSDRGYYCFPAFDDHSPIDLITVDKIGNTCRLQIKYRNPSSRNPNKYELPTCSVVNGIKRKINLDLIDGWAVYLANIKKVVYISKKIVGNKTSFLIDKDENYGDLGEWFKPAFC